tara:strand:+ start:111 stop:254 length:144 start_codon:yes stop_codon:yes gene_type:complete
MRKNYPRLRNGKLEGKGLPPHFVDEKRKRLPSISQEDFQQPCLFLVG